MTVVYRFATLILLLTITSGHAFSQNPYRSPEAASLVRSELLRYQAAFRQYPSSTLAEDRIDVRYYRLDLRIGTSSNYIRGRISINADCLSPNLDSIRLDLMNSLTIDSIIVGGHSAGFHQQADGFVMALDRTYHQGESIGQIDVYYQGVPGSSGFGSYAFSSHGSPAVPWVWSLSEPYGAKDWWPCKDHPSDKADSVDILVTVDSSYKVGSNGSLVSVTPNGDGTSTWRWHESYPISTYLISIAITNYSQFTNYFRYTPTDSMPVLNFVLPEDYSSAVSQLPRILDGLSVYSSLFGLYPFITEKYGHSEFGWGGGMEHQTMTSLGGFSESLIMHELAHQWFGDMITCRTWPDIWLNEGFATYCEALYQERMYGGAAYRSDMNGLMSSGGAATSPLYVQDSSSVGTLFDWNRVYAKGATVLHMLRHVLGDSVFFQAMYQYAHDPALRFGTATTADFRRVCENVSGRNLSPFFAEWVYGQYYPRYLYGWNATADSAGARVSLSIGQSEPPGSTKFFSMPIDVHCTAAGMDTTIVVNDTSAGQNFSFVLPAAPTAITLDPGNWILKKVWSMFSPCPAFVAFDSVGIGTTATRIVTVRNLSTSILVVTNVVSNQPAVTVSPTTVQIPGNGTAAFTVRWTPVTMGALAGTLTFSNNGAAGPAVLNVTGAGVTAQFVIDLLPRWNMVSLPVDVDNPAVQNVFPTSVDKAYSWTGSGYQKYDSLTPGKGYWIRSSSGQSLSIPGILRDTDSITVAQGWNMIGTISRPVGTAQIIPVPTDIVTSEFFGYRLSYRPADTLMPGYGYWVKADRPGVLVLPPPAGAAAGLLKISAAGELPPPPPDISGTPERRSGIPASYTLSQNVPNPFNPATMIRFTLPSDAYVRLGVFNLLGERVALIVDGMRPAGSYDMMFDGSALPSGTYYYRIDAVPASGGGSAYSNMKKMIIIK